MKILGIDPGLTRCGFGLISSGASRKVSLLRVGIFQSSPSLALEQRIGTIGDALDALIRDEAPDVIALERVFSQQNLHSVMGTAQISGVVLYLASKYELSVVSYTPTEVKAAVTGSGRANKTQVQNMVAKILGMGEAPKPADAADALAISICHAWKGGAISTGSSCDGVGGAASDAKAKWLEAERTAKRKRA